MEFSESLKKNRDFQLVYRKGASAANRFLVMYVRKNQLEKNRIGISVSKKVGNSVVRHRLTRLIREAYRLNESCFKKGLDVVIIARVTAKGTDQQQITDALLHLSRIHHIQENKHETHHD
jgi:ribonuclease P protein component